jgi:CNT family concentrative nucleoside transporter
MHTELPDPNAKLRAADVAGSPPAAGTPWSWRAALVVVVVGVGVAPYLLGDLIGPRGQSALGVAAFLSLAGAISRNLRAINWRTMATGFGLQLFLAWFVMRFEVFGAKPGYQLFEALAAVAKQFLTFTDVGAAFVFGQEAVDKHLFAFAVLPTIIFISSLFAVLYHFGILQLVVRWMARLMMWLMGTSGAETLSVSANVFVGQTEAPLIVRPYVPGMTQSELLTLMVSGMAHISGSLVAVYIGMGADPVAILATSVMAAPCSLYLSKLVLPELAEPETRGEVKTAVEEKHANFIDAAAAGASEGVRLAINIAAMLVAFLAFIAMINYVLREIDPDLSLQSICSWLFSPVAKLMGVEAKDVGGVADLLGIKLVANEFVAYAEFKKHYLGVFSPRSTILVTYALTGFANFASIGIQLGGIGGMAPTRRGDLARLGGRALLTGFLVTLVNASIAGMMLEE